MIKQAPSAGNPRRARVLETGSHPLRLTGLLYLKEALLKERYEHCPEIIAIAKEFGATQAEVGYLLEDPRRRPG